MDRKRHKDRRKAEELEKVGALKNRHSGELKKNVCVCACAHAYIYAKLKG